MNTKHIRLTTTASTRENTNKTRKKKHNTQNTNNKGRSALVYVTNEISLRHRRDSMC
jgi:hypothetical protein